MDVRTLNRLFVSEWRLVPHEWWGRFEKRLGAASLSTYLDALALENAPHWTSVCKRPLLTPFLRPRLLNDSYHDLVIEIDPATKARIIIFDELSHGGQGTTYLAYHNADPVNPVVVVKTSNRFPSSPRFRLEYDTLAGLTSPYLPSVLHFDSPRARFVMSYFQGDSLEQFIRQAFAKGKRVPLQTCLGLAKHFADALSTIHRCRLVHRDIKPANVILRHHENHTRGCLVDWGIVKDIENPQTLTHFGFLGTTYYVAPECRVAPQDATAHADIYSLACTLFCMLVGEPPFFEYFMSPHDYNDRSHHDRRRCEERNRQQHYYRASDFRPQVPAELDELIHQALRWDTSQRPPNGQAVFDLLQQIPVPLSDFRQVAPVELDRGRLILLRAYRDVCREQGASFASIPHLTRVFAEIPRVQDYLLHANVTRVATANHAAQKLVDQMATCFNQITSQIAYVGNIQQATEPERYDLMNYVLDRLQQVSVLALQLHHRLCE